jgi:hypothetical protein
VRVAITGPITSLGRLRCHFELGRAYSLALQKIRQHQSRTRCASPCRPLAFQIVSHYCGQSAELGINFGLIAGALAPGNLSEVLFSCRLRCSYLYRRKGLGR